MCSCLRVVDVCVILLSIYHIFWLDARLYTFFLLVSASDVYSLRNRMSFLTQSVASHSLPPSLRPAYAQVHRTSSLARQARPRASVSGQRGWQCCAGTAVDAALSSSLAVFRLPSRSLFFSLSTFFPCLSLTPSHSPILPFSFSIPFPPLFLILISSPSVATVPSFRARQARRSAARGSSTVTPDLQGSQRTCPRRSAFADG